MDNDNKINMNLNNKAEVRLFLKEELLPLEKSHRVTSYDLSSEYSKTKKNRSYFIWIMMISCFLSVVLITTLVVRHLSVKNRQITVSSEVFTDLDMSSLLSSRSHLQMEYLVAENEAVELRKTFELKTQQATQKRDSELQLASALRLENLNTKQRSIRAIYNQEIAALHSEYDEKLANSDELASSLKKKLDEMDLVAARNAAAVGFANEVQQHERSKIVSSLQATISAAQIDLKNNQKTAYLDQQAAIKKLGDKYHSEVDALDPILKDETATAIIQNSPKEASLLLENFVNDLPKSALTNDFFVAMQRTGNLYNDYSYIHSKIAQIPQKNSMESYKTTENSLVIGMLSEIGKAVSVQIKRLNGIRLDLESQVAKLSAQNTNLQSQNSSLQAEIETVQSDFSKLKTQYDGVSGNIEMFNSWFEQKAVDDSAVGYILDNENVLPLKAFLISSVRDSLLNENAVQVDVIHGRKKVSSGIVTQADGVFFFTPNDEQTLPKIISGDKLTVVVEK